MAAEKEKITQVDAGLSEQAMAQVLQAEEKANQAIRDCEQVGVALIQDAKNRAQRISKHADSRISHIHLRFKQCIARQVKDLQREYAQQQKQIHAEHYDAAEVDDIVERVAEMLTGSSRSGKG
jgi:predicted amino acid dehydrogenase